MERAAFLLEQNGERIPCLLNPASVVVRRQAGIRQRHSGSGPLTGAGLSDDPVLYSGGGKTEVLLDLLFDVSLAGSTVNAIDVRDLTRPLTDLAEGKQSDDGYGQVPLVRFVWGKAWNILGVVAAVAERLENFTEGGEPQRSWLRMRFLRTSEQTTAASESRATDLPLTDLPDELDVPPDQLRFHQVESVGGGDEEKGETQRLDEIATAHYGNPALWRLIAVFNNIDNPLEVPAGAVLSIPPESSLGAAT